MAETKLLAVMIVVLVAGLSNVDLSESQELGKVRFTNKSNNTVVTIENFSESKIFPDIGFDGFVEFNQSIDSSSVSLFHVTNSKTSELIANLVVPTGLNVSFFDVEGFDKVVVAVGF
ncbi:hypothetical protein Mapa_002245 [Marchantia paleacea]|nr:hypothetical protein Mapa_002245 [Marchantia paleacea]